MNTRDAGLFVLVLRVRRSMLLLCCMVVTCIWCWSIQEPGMMSIV